jgi:hypothetical protein
MENHVRIYRENPIAWWDKPVMRFLRNKYGKDFATGQNLVKEEKVAPK